MYWKTDIGDVFWINFMHVYTDGHMLVCCVSYYFSKKSNTMNTCIAVNNVK